jgi:hypothetical protein
MGLWKVPGAQGQSKNRAECYAECVETGQNALKFALKACQYAHEPHASYLRGWARVRKLLRLGAFSLVWDVFRMEQANDCYQSAQGEYQRFLNDCIAECKDTCPSPRSLQSASSTTASSCEFTPPAKPSPPAVPPAPAAEGGPCSSCELVTPEAHCDYCPTVDTGFICCALPAVGGKSPCCP